MTSQTVHFYKNLQKIGCLISYSWFFYSREANMTSAKCREVIKFYRENLIGLFYEGIDEGIIGKRPEIIEPKPLGDDELIIWPMDQERGLAHLFYMLDMMEKFLDEGRTEKAYGWLCFIQGVC